MSATQEQAVAAFRTLTDMAGREPDVRTTLAAIASRHGYPNFAAYARDHYDEVVALADSFTDLEEQTR